MAWASLTSGVVPETQGTLMLSHRDSRILCKPFVHSINPFPEGSPSPWVGGDGRGVAGRSGPGPLNDPARKETYLTNDETKEDRSGLASIASWLAESPAPCSPT